MKRKAILSVGLAVGALAVVLLLSGCDLEARGTFQGRLTDASGNPLNGRYRLIFKFYHSATGGTPIYTETQTLTVTNGLFDAVVGPVLPDVDPAELTKPLWVEVTVSDRATITETLTPRQRLLGAPYAFTLMPGAVISDSFDTNLAGAAGLDAILTVVNAYDGTTSNPAMPALRVAGETGLELAGRPGSDNGFVWSDRTRPSSDLWFYSNDQISFDIDEDDNEIGHFYIYGNPGQCNMDEAGNWTCSGTKSAVVTTQNYGQRQLYAIESPGVWFEDFGSAALKDGVAVVLIDPLFAQTVNLDEYHLFLTPLGECNGLYVAEKAATSFTVRELGGGTSDVAFDYRIVAHRLGYENVRLEQMTLGSAEEEEEERP